MCEVDELDAIARLVAHGLGLALEPQTATHRRWPAAIRVADLGDQTFHRDIGVIHRISRTLSEPVRTLAQFIVGAYATSTQDDNGA